MYKSNYFLFSNCQSEQFSHYTQNVVINETQIKSVDTGYLLMGNKELAPKIGLKASRRMVFYNGKIECRLLKYELYKGTRQK